MEYRFIPEEFKALEKEDMDKNMDNTLENFEKRLNEEFGSEFSFRISKGRNDKDILD